MRVRFQRLARREMYRAAAWYEREAPGTGEDLLLEIASTLRSIAAHPNLGRPFDSEVRAFGVRRYPYRIVYYPTPDAILVIAVAHNKRRPGYWMRRSWGE